MEQYSTVAIEDGLSECSDLEELKGRILPLLRSQRAAWSEKLEEIMTQKSLSCAQMARLCGVSEPAVRKWRRGAIPQKRDMFLRIGFAAGYSLSEMNTFLKRYGKCPQLYARSLEDSVCIFVLNSKEQEHTYACYLRVLEQVKRELENGCTAQDNEYSTEYLRDSFLRMDSQEEMTAFVKDVAPSFQRAYAKLYSYVIAFLQINLQSEFTMAGDGRQASFHSMAEESCWSSSLRHCISEIRGKRWFPLRHKVISLGLHLNMNVDAINKMLGYAQMEPLYAKNPVEAAVMWAINEAQLCSEDDEIIPDGSADLCLFVKDILEQLELAEEGSYLFEDL